MWLTTARTRSGFFTSTAILAARFGEVVTILLAQIRR